MDVRFEVMDVTRIPRHGPGYDLIVDSYCLQGIVLDEDRQVVDRRTGRVFDGYDDDCLYDRDADLCYWPYDGEAGIDGAITVDGARFFRPAAIETVRGCGGKLSPTASRYSFRQASGVRTLSPSTAATGSACSYSGMVCSRRPER